MPTVPTHRMERELRALYLRWISDLNWDDPDLYDKVTSFGARANALIGKLGGQAASLGALAGFPVPKELELSPRVGTIYNELHQAAIKASIAAGLNSREAARAMFRSGMDKSYRKLERLARTETVSAYWKNQWDSTANLPAIVMVWGSEESKKTCDYCLSRDGLVVEDANIRDHPNGRCTLIPTLRSQVKYKGTLQPDGSVYQDPAWTKKPKEDLAKLTSKELKTLQQEANQERYALIKDTSGDEMFKRMETPAYKDAAAKEQMYREAYNTRMLEEKALRKAKADAKKAAAEATRKAQEKVNAEIAARQAKAADGKKISTLQGPVYDINDPELIGGVAVQRLAKLKALPKDLKAAIRRGAANPRNRDWVRAYGVGTEGSRDYSINCTRVANAVEMRRRGYDVKAAPAGTKADKSDGWVVNNWIRPENGETPSLIKTPNAKVLMEQMNLAPEGARFMVVGPWKSGGAHIWNAEKVNGKVVFIEGQAYTGGSGEVTQHYLRNLDFENWAYTSNSVRFMRVDNLRPHPDIVKSFEK